MCVCVCVCVCKLSEVSSFLSSYFCNATYSWLTVPELSGNISDASHLPVGGLQSACDMGPGARSPAAVPWQEICHWFGDIVWGHLGFAEAVLTGSAAAAKKSPGQHRSTDSHSQGDSPSNKGSNGPRAPAGGTADLKEGGEVPWSFGGWV